MFFQTHLWLFAFAVLPAALAATYPRPVTIKPSGLTLAQVREFETPSPELEKHGRKLYVRMCAECHGLTGKGDGPKSKHLKEAARNFHGPTDDWVNGSSSKSIYVSLTFGLPHRNVSPRDQWDLTPRDRWALIHYLHTLTPKVEITGKQDALYEKALAADGIGPK